MGRVVEELTCPKCGCKEFLKGPQGGLATNVKCSNCGYWMNIVILPNSKIWVSEEAEEA